jgi:hypothetical protein
MGGLLLVVTALVVIRREWPGGEAATGEGREVDSTRQVPDRNETKPRERRPRPEGRRFSLPVFDREKSFKLARSRDGEELDYRIQMLEEKVALSPVQVLNLRHHMEKWYAAMARERETAGRWGWPDHREIHWSRCCGSLFVASEEQRDAWLALSADLERQRVRNEARARELLAELKARMEFLPHQETLLVDFLVGFQASRQHRDETGRTEEIPWREGLASGEFDPLADLLDADQLSGVARAVQVSGSAR